MQEDLHGCVSYVVQGFYLRFEIVYTKVVLL